MPNLHIMILMLLSTYLSVQTGGCTTPDGITTTSSSGPTTTGIRTGQYTCIPTTPAPPELRPIDQDAGMVNLILMLSISLVYIAG